MAGFGQSLGQALGQFAFGGNTQDATMKGMLAGAQAHSFDATAKKGLAEALKAEAETRLYQQQEDSRKPEAIFRNAIQQFGVPTDDAPAVEQFMKTGALGGRFAPSIDGMGPVTPQPDWARQLPGLVRSMGNTNIALSLGDKSVENVAKANAMGREMSLGDDVIAGRLDPLKLSQSQFALKGSAPFAFNEYGTGNNLTGKLDDTTGPAIRFGDKRIAETSAEKAKATASNAAAGASSASAGKYRAETDKIKQETQQGAKGVLRDTDQGLVLVNPMTAQSTPVNDGTGKQLTKTKSGGPMSVTLQKELLESDDVVQLSGGIVKTLEKAKTINKDAYSGYAAKGRAVLRSNLPGASSAADNTIDIDNMMTGQGLDQMKTIFGAAPTEGERKILMDMQASADKTPEQREKIMDRAISAAKTRAQYAANKAKSIRDGSYLTRGAEAMPAEVRPAASPQDQQALQWAQSNPNDPRSAKILQRLGVK